MGMGSGLLTIGALARRGKVSVRTVRFWSDEGLIPVAKRSPKGYRLYGPEAVARLELVRTLRELGVGLDAIAAVLAQSATPAEVAAAHVRALDEQIRALRAQRAVLRVIARRDPCLKETTIMTAIARMSAAERQKLLDDFVNRAFAGLPPDAPGRGIGEAMRTLPTELPDEPSAEVLGAWIELAELVSDPSFAARVREMVLAGAAPAPPASGPSPQLVAQHAGDAARRGVAPASDEGRAILELIVPRETSREERARLREHLETFTDERVERYWELAGILSGRPPFPKAVPAYRWLIDALRASEAT